MSALKLNTITFFPLFLPTYEDGARVHASSDVLHHAVIHAAHLAQRLSNYHVRLEARQQLLIHRIQAYPRVELFPNLARIKYTYLWPKEEKRKKKQKTKKRKKEGKKREKREKKKGTCRSTSAEVVNLIFEAVSMGREE